MEVRVDKCKTTALELALRQIEQLQASQPAGLFTIKPSSKHRFHCKSIERERPGDVYRSQCPYVGISIAMNDVRMR